MPLFTQDLLPLQDPNPGSQSFLPTERFLTLRRAPCSQLRGGLFKFSPRRLVLMNNAKKSLINWLQFAYRTHTSTHTEAHTHRERHEHAHLAQTDRIFVFQFATTLHNGNDLCHISALTLPLPELLPQPEPRLASLCDSCVSCTLFSSIQSTNANANACAESSLGRRSSS